MFIKNISTWFPFFVISLSGLGTKVMLALCETGLFQPLFSEKMYVYQCYLFLKCLVELTRESSGSRVFFMRRSF